MDSRNNYFELFGLPVDFLLDRSLLQARYLALQQRFHPDRQAGRSGQEQRLAVQSAAWVNQANETLRSPVRRAEYLLQLADRAPSGDQTINDSGFLMQQMALRERLADIPAEAEPAAALDELESKVRAALVALEAEFASAYREDNLSLAGELLLKMQFYHKLLSEVVELEDAL